MPIVSRIAVFAFAGMTAALLSPPHLLGEEMDFFPRVEYMTGSLELDMQRRDYKTTSGNNTLETVYDSNTEKIRLDGDGYVYHPRFLIFHLDGAVGLLQDYSDTGGGAFRNNHGFNEYDADVMLLPEHPYSLELFTRRKVGSSIPFAAENIIYSSQGALFQYKQRPLYIHLGAIATSYEYSTDWSDAKTYNAGGSYSIGPTTNTAEYNHTDTTTSRGEQTGNATTAFNNTFSFGHFSLLSDVSSGRQSQGSSFEAPSFGTETSNWSERLRAELPHNFSVYAEHRYRKEVDTTERTLPSFSETTVFSKSTQDDISITQQLFNSLRTSYYASQQSSETTGGDQTDTLQMLSLNYNKMIPGGTVYAGYSFQDLSSTRHGASIILNEPHPSIAVPGFFSLNSQAVDQSTITVKVKNPNDPNDLVTLTEGSAADYTVQQFGNTVQITVSRLTMSFNPPAAGNINIYDFVVSYSLVPNDSQTDLKANSFNLRFLLFEGLFGPYFNYTTSDLKVIAGTFPGGDTKVITKTYGFTVQRDPLSFFLERVDSQSTYNPYRSLRAETEYRQVLTEDTDVLVRLSVNQIVHLATVIAKGSFEKMTSMEATVHKRFPYENLDLFAGGVYSVIDVIGYTTTNYTLNTGLKWHVGNLDISAFGLKTYSISNGTAGNQTTVQDGYYLVVSRKLF